MILKTQSKPGMFLKEQRALEGWGKGKRSRDITAGGFMADVFCYPPGNDEQTVWAFRKQKVSFSYTKKEQGSVKCELQPDMV